MYDCVLHALKIGYRVIDTAVLYNNHVQVGQAIETALRLGIIASRDELCVITKVLNRDHKAGVNAILSSLNEACVDLQMSVLDVVLLHSFMGDRETRVAWQLLVNLKQQGRIREIGVSNFNMEQLQTVVSIHPPFVNQIEVSPFRPALQVCAMCRSLGILIQTHSPLLKAKHLTNPVLLQIALELNCSVADVLLSWAVNAPNGYSTVVRSTQSQHMSSNLSVQERVQLQEHHLIQLQQQLSDSNIVTHSQFNLI